MARAEGPLFSYKVWGQFGKEIIFTRFMGKSILRNYYIPRVPATESQLKNWACLKNTVALYRMLKQNDQEAWERRAGSRPLTGYNCFIKTANRVHHRLQPFNLISEVEIQRLTQENAGLASSSIQEESQEESRDFSVNANEKAISPDCDVGSDAGYNSDSDEVCTAGSKAVFQKAGNRDYQTGDNDNEIAAEVCLKTGVRFGVKVRFMVRFDSTILLCCWPVEGSRGSAKGITKERAAQCRAVEFKARGWESQQNNFNNGNNSIIHVNDSNNVNATKNVNNLNGVNGVNGVIDVNDVNGVIDINDVYDVYDVYDANDINIAKNEKNEENLEDVLAGGEPGDLLDFSEMANKTVVNETILEGLEPGRDYVLRLMEKPGQLSGPDNLLVKPKNQGAGQEILAYAVSCRLAQAGEASLSRGYTREAPAELDGENPVSLNWDPVPGATCYYIYREFSSAGLAAGLIASTEDTSFLDCNQEIIRSCRPPELKPLLLSDGESGDYLISGSL